MEMIRLKLELYERLEQIMEHHNSEFLMRTLFDFLDLASFMELMDYIEFIESQLNDNKNEN